MFCTPECAASLPGSFKTRLDWTVGGRDLPGTAAWIPRDAVGTDGPAADPVLRGELTQVAVSVAEPAAQPEQ
jgi:hypothetical protein